MIIQLFKKAVLKMCFHNYDPRTIIASIYSPSTLQIALDKIAPVLFLKAVYTTKAEPSPISKNNLSPQYNFCHRED